MDFAASELDLIIQAYQELYPEEELSRCFFFFDEIQNIKGWERFVRRIYDTVSRHIFITGSNARMLGTEISTSLRGRSISYEILPLSFREFLRFKGISYEQYLPESRAKANHAFQEYMEFGGFPELVFTKEEELKYRILQEYFHVMLFRDLVEHYGIKNITALKYFLKRLFSNATKPLSINRIFNDLKSANLKIGKNSLYAYLDYAESVYLARTIKKYSFKLPAREFGERKVYVIDNGLLNALVFRFTGDRGKALEQIVFWELYRRGRRIFFMKNSFECDFIIHSGKGAKSAIQVCLDPGDPSTRKREIKGLIAACRKLGLEKGTIVSLDDREELEAGEVLISVVPIVDFLMSGS